jgi:ubiquinone/menaquinone biosynthesis C-methylase UbiE
MSHSHLTALERVEQCQSVEDMVKAFPDSIAAPFDDPVVARLYDILLASERASMIKSAVDDFCTAIGVPRQGARFLDVGCGTGRMILDMSTRFPESQCTFVGVDPSAEMIAIANENRQELHHRKDITFLCGALTDNVIKQHTQDVDYLIIRNTVSWMNDPVEELRVWLERLKPGGQILIREIRQGAYFPLLKARVRKCLAFKANDLTLAYPPSAMVAAYRSALTLAELVTILNRCDIAITTTRPGERDDVTAEPWGVDMSLVGEKARD